MAANVRHLLYIDKQERSDDNRCPHVRVESVVINAGCDVVMAAVVSIILLEELRAAFKSHHLASLIDQPAPFIRLW